MPEPAFSRAQAVRTPAFWLLLAYTVLVYPAQAGVSLHQASHLVERGIDPGTAATIVSVFSFMSGVGTLASGFLARRCRCASCSPDRRHWYARARC